MNSLNDLFALDYLNDTERCIAFCTDKNIGNCFAISGVKLLPEERQELIDIIRGVLGSNFKECNLEDSISFLDGTADFKALKNKQFCFYSDLERNGFASIDYSGNNIDFMFYSSDYSFKHLFSCVERKIIGYWYKNGYKGKVPTIYVIKEPCYKCLGIIEKAYYIYDHFYICGIKKQWTIGSKISFKSINIK